MMQTIRNLIKLFTFFVCFEFINSVNKGQPPEDINDLFPTISPDNDSLSYNLNTTIDIGKIDLKQLMKKISSVNESIVDNLTNHTRRQVLVYTWAMGKANYHQASDIMTRQKTLDLMLQTIYMARHIMRELESSPYFSVKDTGFRVGYLHTKIVKFYEDAQYVYSTMYMYRGYAHKVTPYLIMHNKILKLYTDFVYFWWVLVRLDGLHRDSIDDPPKLPSWVKDGGISEEVVPIG